MSVNICNMLYIHNVAEVAEFWKAAGFVELKRQGEGQELTVVVAPSADSNARLQLWDIDFIRKVSPEVAESKPSLLFTVENLEAWHEKISKLAKTISAINEVPFKNFNFADPDGNYYAFAESELPS
ncbi:MAG: hypothetical protein LBI13_02000 [Streptococcaceae bacterium]|jgi:hypothetical protein|nr:hypothetical protein [Streptococcaceae bacterium]